MAKIIYQEKGKSVLLSQAEALLLFAAEFGAEMLDAFFPAQYPETWWTRRLLGLDSFNSRFPAVLPQGYDRAEERGFIPRSEAPRKGVWGPLPQPPAATPSVSRGSVGRGKPFRARSARVSPSELNRANVRVAKYRLIRQGLVAKRRDGSYGITSRGESAAGELEALFRKPRRPVWDRKWRVVVFDIPEGMKKYREGLRRELAAIGYVRLQDSVWIGKQPLPEEVVEFIEACNLDRYVYLFLSDTVDKDERVRALFGRASA